MDYTGMAVSKIWSEDKRVRFIETRPSNIYPASYTQSHVIEARNPPVPVVHVTRLPEGFVKQTFLQSKLREGRCSSGWQTAATRLGRDTSGDQ
ncbi:hypothetical protein J3R82DRAFT_1208 [Butyriboletus roseoflavus]|nr:hypothetical protein J3R82DRAFT_1208 [Butyriboletus roseoflavus]